MNLELYKIIINEFNNSNFKESYNLAIKLNKDQYDEKILKILTISSFKIQNYIDAIKYGLKLYTSKKIENDKQILNILGVSYSINKDYENGNFYLEKFLLIDPKNKSVKYNLALNYFEQKKYISAEKILSEFISKQIEFENVELIYGMIHSELKNYNKAIEVFKNLINRKKSLADVFYNLGITYQKINNYSLSIKYLKKAIEENNTNYFFFNSLGVSQQKLFNYTEAEKNYNLAITLNKNYSNAFSNLGLLKKRQGFFDDAIKCFDQALNIEPKNSQILYNKSISLLEKGNYKEGLNLYKWRQNGKYAKNNHLNLDINTIKDKKILITCDQGLGDIILLSRYVLLLLNYNAKVVFQIPKSLEALFKNFNKEIHLTSEPVLKDNFNYIYSLGDLLKIFEVDELNIKKKVPLFRGLHYSLLASGIERGVQFGLYDFFKSKSDSNLISSLKASALSTCIGIPYNFYIVNKILESLNLDSERISYVEDRPGHDFRYAVNFDKLLDTGWKPQKNFDSEIENIVNWYKANKEWLSRGVVQVNKNRKGRLFLNNLES